MWDMKYKSVTNFCECDVFERDGNDKTYINGNMVNGQKTILQKMHFLCIQRIWGLQKQMKNALKWSHIK